MIHIVFTVSIFTYPPAAPSQQSAGHHKIALSPLFSPQAVKTISYCFEIEEEIPYIQIFYPHQATSSKKKEEGKATRKTNQLTTLRGPRITSDTFLDTMSSMLGDFGEMEDLIQETTLASLEPKPLTSREERIIKKSSTFIHHTHIVLSKINDGNFAAVVRTIEAFGGGVIHRILENDEAEEEELRKTQTLFYSHKSTDRSDVTNTQVQNQKKKKEKRKEINGSEKYVLLNTYKDVDGFISYINTWEESGIRPDYEKWYGKDDDDDDDEQQQQQQQQRRRKPRLLCTEIPREQALVSTVSKAMLNTTTNNPHYNDVNDIPLQPNDTKTHDTLLVFGSEMNPISNKILSIANGTFAIPMYGLAESFNVSVAVSICYYVVRLKVGALGDGEDGEGKKVEGLLLRRSLERGFVQKTRKEARERGEIDNGEREDE